MTLRVRLLLGYGYLVGLMILAAGSATIGFLDLSARIDVVLEENVRSIRATMSMLEALERQDSATLAALIEGAEPGAEMAALEEGFLEALAEASSNVTEQGESALIAAIAEGFEAYRRDRDRLLAARPAEPLAEYNRLVFPTFAAVKQQVLELLDVNQRAIVEADRQVQAQAIRSAAWLGFLVGVALLSLVFLSRGLQRRVLHRLSQLERGTATVVAGDVQRRLPEEGSDELTLVARRLNLLLDQYQQLDARMRGRLAQEHQLALGLLDHLGEGAAIFGLGGELLAGRLGGCESALARWLRVQGRRRLLDREHQDPTRERNGTWEPVTLETGELVEVALLRARGERPVGFVARRAEPPGG